MSFGGKEKMISARDRRKAVELVTEAVAAGARALEACKCLGIAFSSYLKWRDCPEDEDQRPKREFAVTPRALSSEERQAVYERYCQPDVCDLSVRQAFYVLLDKGEYLPLSQRCTVFCAITRPMHAVMGFAPSSSGTCRQATKRRAPIKSGRGVLRTCETQSTPHAFTTPLW